MTNRDWGQQGGTDKSVGDLDGCNGAETNREIGKITSVSGSILDPDASANPCGLVAKSIFNDTFTLNQGGTAIKIDETSIAWKDDDIIFARPTSASDSNYANNVQWIDVTDEHFKVWMRTSATSKFTKLWGRIRTDL